MLQNLNYSTRILFYFFFPLKKLFAYVDQLIPKLSQIKAMPFEFYKKTFNNFCLLKIETYVKWI